MTVKNGYDKGDYDKDDYDKAFWRPQPSALNARGGASTRRLVAMGWNPDVPDFRDFNLDSHDTPVNDKGVVTGKKQLLSDVLCHDKPPKKVDLSETCSPIEDQQELGSCTAQAVVGLMEYMMRKSGNEHIDGSRLFVYKVTRNLLGLSGDTGAHLRSTMHAVRAFGVPPETLWPYVIDRYEDEPTPFLYSYAQNFKMMRYVRLDKPGISREKVLENIKSVLAQKFPVVFGFTVYSSISGDADIPFPNDHDRRSGGHAVMAVGYDDDHKVKYVDKRTGKERVKKVPSLIIRNSWGTGWGEQGYGYLPYTYVISGLAQDFWTSFMWEWIDTGNFK